MLTSTLGYACYSRALYQPIVHSYAPAPSYIYDYLLKEYVPPTPLVQWYGDPFLLLPVVIGRESSGFTFIFIYAQHPINEEK